MKTLLKEITGIFLVIVMLLSMSAFAGENDDITMDDDIGNMNFYGLKNLSEFDKNERVYINYNNSKFWGIDFENIQELRGGIDE